jgi:hypothetical protein
MKARLTFCRMSAEYVSDAAEIERRKPAANADNLNVCMANSKLGQNPLSSSLATMRHVRSDCSPGSSHDHRFAAHSTRRSGSVVAESVLIKHQVLIMNRSRHRAPNLRVWDRLTVGFCSLWMKPTRLLRAAIALKPSTLLHFHRALVQRKYRLLFSPKRRTKPGPKGPNPELIRAVVDMKQRHPTWGCPCIANQITPASSGSCSCRRRDFLQE